MVSTGPVFSEMLEDRGIEIVGKGDNGKEAIDLYFANNPDIVFVDMMMPDGSGFYAIKKIRNKDPKAVLITVTADVTTLTEEKLKKTQSKRHCSQTHRHGYSHGNCQNNPKALRQQVIGCNKNLF